MSAISQQIIEALDRARKNTGMTAIPIHVDPAGFERLRRELPDLPETVPHDGVVTMICGRPVLLKVREPMH